MKTTQVKFYIHEVTEASVNNKGLEAYKVGDIAVFALAINDEKAFVLDIKELKGHKVSESEAGTGIYAQAQAGDLGAIGTDGQFFTADELSELYMEDSDDSELVGDEARELNEELLNSVVGGFSLKWNTKKFIRCVVSGVIGATGGAAGVALGVAGDLLVSGIESVVISSTAAHKGTDISWKDAFAPYKDVLPFDVEH